MKKILNILTIILSLSIRFSCSKDSSEDSFDDGKTSTAGKAGSMARMIIKNNYLYAIDGQSLKVVDISDNANPILKNTVNIGFGIETIFPGKDDKLFIGSTTGMFIYSTSNPENPTRLSEFTHFTACDPVIANDSIAFVTLRISEVCGRWTENNQVQAINIKDLNNPFLIASYSTSSAPYGLEMDIDNNHLFVCHGVNGVYVYDIKKLLEYGSPTINIISGVTAYDAVIYNNILFVIGETGFYQYDFSDIYDIKLISSIPKNS